MNSVFIYILYSVVQIAFIPVISECYKKMRYHSTELYKAIIIVITIHFSTNILILHYDKN